MPRKSKLSLLFSKVIKMKKGSLQLSINMIIIIILAIVLLGLSLSFMKDFMGRGAEQFIGAIDLAKLKNPATVISPITAPSSVNIKAGSPTGTPVDVGF